MYLAKAARLVRRELFFKKQCVNVHLMPTVSDLKYLNYSSLSWT